MLQLISEHELLLAYGLSQVLATVPNHGFGSGSGVEPIRRQNAVRVINKPELSIRVRFNGQLPTRPDLACCQQVVQRIRLYIHIILLHLEFNN
jgi:hypothetical protein